MALESEAELCAAAGVTSDGLVTVGLLLLRHLLAEVLNAHAAFDRPHRKALLIREYRNTPGRYTGAQILIYQYG